MSGQQVRLLFQSILFVSVGVKMNASGSFLDGTFIVRWVVYSIVQITLSDVDGDSHTVFDSHKNVIPVVALLA